MSLHARWLVAVGAYAVLGVAMAAQPRIEADADGKTSQRYRQLAREEGIPVLLRLQPPSYPRDAYVDKEEGCAVLAFRIRKDGKTDQYQVLQSLPLRARFDEVAKMALSHWEFEPQAEERQAVQPFIFNLAAEASVAPKGPRPKCAVPLVDLVATGGEKGMPTVKSKVAPSFPPERVKAGTRGCVLASFKVGAKGRAEDFQVLASRPEKAFDQAVLSALAQWRFQKPAADLGRGMALYRFSYVDDPAGSAPECAIPPQFGKQAPATGAKS